MICTSFTSSLRSVFFFAYGSCCCAFIFRIRIRLKGFFCERSKESQTFRIYVRGTIVLRNSYSVQQNTLLPLTFGLLDVSWPNYLFDGLVIESAAFFSFNCFLVGVLNLLKEMFRFYFSPSSLGYCTSVCHLRLSMLFQGYCSILQTFVALRWR